MVNIEKIPEGMSEAVLAFKITEADVKTFMAQLLCEDVFHTFDVRGAEITAMTKFQISGILDKDFTEAKDEGDVGNYCTWEVLQPIVRELVKGKVKPKNVKLTFSLPMAQTAALHPNASAFFLNIHYENNEILCTTGTGEKVFSMNKAVDAVWEEHVKAFIAKKGIVVSTWVT